ncbi:5-methyltetrahydropteroyltriglutamate--homocysteine S-methyltransferase [Actinomycetospora sp. TBRC 11914]|uniref:5-methyltetrahydropteroyltriglutamate-- homocysteine S-methyltransferase n=1 Tax=Actinomycetospora sp. TBRC 11914 TaxID=2729387 RepID=UPI00145EABCA|nr:5-methyltetrahydropteroyltriglutamate--homocysteine S-methyltransferase [Actinomycetospora sp. TBRC 11914]NMO90170.1 5-methyltetrahydropteroyltriglutamate--homocysteine S-methyltransferase [Actinomycetospora sp. TBRC 11914]
MSARKTAPFRADHVGSLLRPPALLTARAAHAEGRLGDDELRAAEDDAIRDVVAMQESVGLQAATDGEFRRTSWHMDFLYQLDGVSSSKDSSVEVAFRNASGNLTFASMSLVIDRRIGLSTTIFGDAFSMLASTVTSAVPKLTIPSPSMLHYRLGGAPVHEGSPYTDPDQFWSDLAGAYREEISRLYGLGVRYLQLDDTSLAYLNDPAQRESMAARGEDADHMHERYVDTINAALSGRPDDLRVTTHMCRGNYRSSWAAEGGYDHVAEKVFGGLEVDGFFCEYDDARSGDFSPLRYLPRGDQQVVLGLVTTKSGQLESPDTLKRRIDEASQVVPLEQLCLSPQCGFSSTVEGNELSYDQEVAKLELIVSVAEDVWGS